MFFGSPVYLIDEIQKLLLRWIHAHGPHCVAELLGCYGPRTVVVELVEGFKKIRIRVFSMCNSQYATKPKLVLQRVIISFYWCTVHIPSLSSAICS